MPRTITPEEQERATDISALKSIKPTPNRKVFVDSDAGAQPNIFLWMPGGDASTADGVEFIESNRTGFGQGEANEGVWQRVTLPFGDTDRTGVATTDELTEGSDNLFYTESRTKDEFSATGDLTYSKNSGGGGFDLANASYKNTSFDVSGEDETPQEVAFNNDGTKMFVVGDRNDIVYEYDLSTGFDISSASFSQSFDVSGQDARPRGIAFNSDGTKMFVVGRGSGNVHEYDLNTGFDVSTAAYNSVSFDVSGQDTQPRGITFNGDGSKMFVVGNNNDSVYEYDLTTGFDISSATYNGVSFDVSGQDGSPTGITFNGNGTKMFVPGIDNDSVYEYDLSTGFDISSATYNNVSFDVSGQDGTQMGMTFSGDGTKMFVVGNDNDSIYSYSTGETSSPAELILDVSSLSSADLFGSKTTDDLPEGTNDLYHTDERAQDAIGNITEGSGRTTAVYDDAGPSLTLETTDEAIQDGVYENVLSGTQTLLTVNYDDANNEVGFEVSDDLGQYDFTNVTTDEISEGAENLYYTSQRVKDEFQAGGDLTYSKNIGTGTATVSLDVSTLSSTDLFGQKRTDDLPEGSNSLYFTGTRSREAVNAALEGIGATITYEESSEQNFGDPLIEISGVGTGPDVADDATLVTQNSSDINFGTGIGTINDNGIADIPLLDQFGSAIFDGDGNSTQFSVQHELTAAPESVQVQAITDDASSISHIDYDSTVITVFYDTPPPTGTDNVQIYYKLKVDLNQAPFWDDKGDLLFSFD